jgi:hypothetical protein
MTKIKKLEKLIDKAILIIDILLEKRGKYGI